MTDSPKRPRDRDHQWTFLAEAQIFGSNDLDGALASLVRVAMPTALRRFYPFTSVTRLCFSDGHRPFENPLPAFVGFDRQRRFAVHHGSPRADAPSTVTLETSDPAEAIKELLRLLSLPPAS